VRVPAQALRHDLRQGAMRASAESGGEGGGSAPSHGSVLASPVEAHTQLRLESR